MATRALSETLRCGGQGGHRRVPTGRGLQGAGDTHQGGGANPGGLAQSCLCLLVVTIELHPVLGEQPCQLGGPCCGVGESPGTPRDLHSHPVQGWGPLHPLHMDTGTPHPETFSLGWGHPSSIPLELFHIPPFYLSSIFPALPKRPSTSSTQRYPSRIPPLSLQIPSSVPPSIPLHHPSVPPARGPSGLTLKSRNAAIQQLRLCSSSLQSSFRPFTPLRTLWGCGRGRSRHGAAPGGSEGTESPWQGEEQGMTLPQAGTSPP